MSEKTRTAFPNKDPFDPVLIDTGRRGGEGGGFGSYLLVGLGQLVVLLQHACPVLLLGHLEHGDSVDALGHVCGSAAAAAAAAAADASLGDERCKDGGSRDHGASSESRLVFLFFLDVVLKSYRCKKEETGSKE